MRRRDLEKSKNEILRVAFEEVFKNSFQGVSVDNIVNKTSLTKGAFYHHFPTKLDLGYALVDEVITPMIIERWIEPLSQYADPLDGILKQIKLRIGHAKPEDLKYGCPLNNLVQEMAPIDAGFRLRLKSALKLWIDETAHHLRRAQHNGTLKKSVKPKELAHFIVMAHEGFYGILKGIGGSEAFEILYRSLKDYFKTLKVS